MIIHCIAANAKKIISNFLATIHSRLIQLFVSTPGLLPVRSVVWVAHLIQWYAQGSQEPPIRIMVKSTIGEDAVAIALSEGKY